MKSPPIRNVVFDIGWVFVRLKYQPLLELLRSRGVEAEDLHSVLARAALEDHESGRLTGLGLLERLAALAPGPLSVDELYAHWIDMFELEPAMVAPEEGDAPRGKAQSGVPVLAS